LTIKEHELIFHVFRHQRIDYLLLKFIYKKLKPITIPETTNGRHF